MTTTILIVDDVPEILEFFARVASAFRTRPVEIVTTSDPAWALGSLDERSYDVVVSDYRMPRVNGIDVLRRARATNPQGRRVLMTGYNEVPATFAEIEAAGLSARLKKPVNAASFVEFLQACTSEGPRALDDFREADAE